MKPQTDALQLSKKRAVFRRWKENAELFLFQVPGIILFLIFCYWPMYGIILSFKKYNPIKGIGGSEWIGFKNFEFFFTSPDAARITRNTLLYNFAFIFINVIFAVTLALMLYNLSRRWMVKTYNTIMILPKFMSMILISYIVYALLNPRSGVINNIIISFGGEAIDWYSDPKYWPAILTIVHVWQTVGYNCIIYYAALMGINMELFEAAKIDGANKWQQTIHIAVPELFSIMSIMIILGFGSIFGGDFGLFYQVPRNVPVLYPTTDILSTYVFRGLMDGNMGVSAAIGLVQAVVGCFMVVVVNLITKKLSPENSLF